MTITRISLFLLCLGTTGCASVGHRLALARLDPVRQRIVVFQGQTAAFNACLRATGGQCPTPTAPAATETGRPALATGFEHLGDIANRPVEELHPSELAARVLDHRVQRRLNALYGYLGGEGASETDLPKVGEDKAEVRQLAFGQDELQEYLDLAGRATLAGGWDQLAADAKSTVNDVKDWWNARLAVYVSAYLGAYFRNGDFLRFKAPSSTKFKQTLDQAYPGIADAVVQRVFKRFFGSEWVFADVGSLGFVSRTGASFQFPSLGSGGATGIGHLSTGSDVDFVRIGADVVRIVLEAVFDAHDLLPAVTNATGVHIDPGEYALPVNDPGKNRASLSPDDFARVNQIANQAEAAVGMAVGRAVRGGGLASLNNEALATLLEAFVGVTVRKVTEKATWCAITCRIGEGGKFKPTEVELVVNRLGPLFRR